MSFSGIFAIGLSGVNAQAESLQSISNNIANTQTTGFRRTRTDFSALVAGGATNANNDQTSGVTAQNRVLFDEQGALTRTSSSTDLAISGEGFFVVSDTALEGTLAETQAFTRSGSFTVQSDGTLVNEAGFALQGTALNGAATGSVSLGGLETVNVNVVEGLSEATDQISLTGNINAASLVGTNLTQRVSVFDANGNQRDVIFNFINDGNALWNVNAQFADTPTETIASGNLTFNADGSVNGDASTFPQTLNIAGGQNIALDFSALTSNALSTNLSQFSANGVAFGALSGIDVSANGVVTANFANGLSQNIFQIALATFTNPEGLEVGPQSTFFFNENAGDIELDVPQAGRAGAIESQALEISTVDIGQEFSALIETQRAYTANTQVISIADELWQTLSQTAV